MNRYTHLYVDQPEQGIRNLCEYVVNAIIIEAHPHIDIGGEVKNDAYFERAFLRFQA